MLELGLSGELNEGAAEGLALPAAGFIAIRVSGKLSVGFAVGVVSGLVFGGNRDGLPCTKFRSNDPPLSAPALVIGPLKEIGSLEGSFDGEGALRSRLAAEFVDGANVGVPKLPSSSGLSSGFFCSATGIAESAGSVGIGSEENGSIFVDALGGFEKAVFANGAGKAGEFASVFKPVWLVAEFEAIVAFAPFFELCVFRMTSRQSAITSNPTATLKERLLLVAAGFEAGCATGMVGAVMGVASTFGLDFSVGPFDVVSGFFVEFAIPPTMFG